MERPSAGIVRSRGNSAGTRGVEGSQQDQNARHVGFDACEPDGTDGEATAQAPLQEEAEDRFDFAGTPLADGEAAAMLDVSDVEHADEHRCAAGVVAEATRVLFTNAAGLHEILGLDTNAPPAMQAADGVACSTL